MIKKYSSLSIPVVFEIAIIDKVVVFILTILALVTDGSGTLCEGEGGVQDDNVVHSTQSSFMVDGFVIR